MALVPMHRLRSHNNSNTLLIVVASLHSHSPWQEEGEERRSYLVNSPCSNSRSCRTWLCNMASD